jgi:hypothetical protein
MQARHLGTVAGLIAAALAVAAIALFVTSHHGESSPGSASVPSPPPAAPARDSAAPSSHPATGASSLATLSARTFTSTVQRGWTVSVKHGRGGTTRYQLSSTGRPIDRLGIPPQGTIGITIDESPATALRRFASGTPSALALISRIVGVPGNATAVTLASPPRPTRLGGGDAAEESYEYSFRGRENIQVDVVGRHRGEVVLAELDAEPALAGTSAAALAALTSHWRWR